jgi:CubicO group peptidase (beta-lactamase class C family)
MPKLAMRAAALFLAAGLTIGMSDTQADSLDAVLDARLSAEDVALCIAAGTVSAQGRRVSVRCSDRTAPRLRPDTIVEIGSISKAFLGILLADASLRGELKLDDPLVKYLPEGSRVPQVGQRPITLLDLATHSSGLPRLPTGFVITNPLDPYAAVTDKDLLDALAATKPDRAPGVRYEYSNFGAMLVSMALQRATGKPFDELLAERIAAPLGMVSTFVVVPEAQRGRLGQGHRADGQRTPAWNIAPNLAGVGMIRASLDDMLKFASANLTPPDSAVGRAIRLSHDKQRAADDGEIGLFWHRRSAADGSIVWHNGGTGGFAAMLAVHPGRGIAAVALSDTQRNLDDLPLHLVDPALPLKRKRVSIAFEPAWLDDYAGRYPLAPNFALTFAARDGRLYAQATGQPEFEVFAAARDRIFWKVVPAAAVFIRDETGRVVALEFTQGGRTTRASKAP